MIDFKVTLAMKEAEMQMLSAIADALRFLLPGNNALASDLKDNLVRGKIALGLAFEDVSNAVTDSNKVGTE